VVAAVLTKLAFHFQLEDLAVELVVERQAQRQLRELLIGEAAVAEVM
jgi:hypothetical protein